MTKIKRYYSVPELAKQLGISRIAVFKKIKNGELKAQKVGRAYIIPEEEVLGLVEGEMSNKTKGDINVAVTKTIDEFGETLKKLGKE